MNLLAAGWFPENGKVGAYVKQALEDVGVGVTLSVPDRPTSIKRIYTDYDFDLAISNQANPSEPIPTTTQYFTTDGIKKGVPFRNANGYSNPDLDALVDKIKVETDPAKRKALVVEFQKITTQEAPLLPLTRARIDHGRQHQGAEPLQRSELSRSRLGGHMAGELKDAGPAAAPTVHPASAGRLPPVDHLSSVGAGSGERRFLAAGGGTQAPAATADPGGAADAGRGGDQFRA